MSRETVALKEFEENMEKNMQILKNNLSLLPDKSKAFASSLCNWYARYQGLSEKQRYHAAKLWEEVVKKSGKEIDSSRGRKVYNTPVDCRKLVEKFQRTSKTLSHPNITYTLLEEEIAEMDDDGYTNSKKIRFSMGTSKGKNPGWIFIGNALFEPERVTYGKIDLEGKLHWEDARYYPSTQLFIKGLVENLLETTSLNGKLTGNCCFCGIELTAGESVSRGYGPICANRWGLPWGLEKQQDLEIGDLI